MPRRPPILDAPLENVILHESLTPETALYLLKNLAKGRRITSVYSRNGLTGHFRSSQGFPKRSPITRKPIGLKNVRRVSNHTIVSFPELRQTRGPGVSSRPLHPRTGPVAGQPVSLDRNVRSILDNVRDLTPGSRIRIHTSVPEYNFSVQRYPDARGGTERRFVIRKVGQRVNAIRESATLGDVGQYLRGLPTNVRYYNRESVAGPGQRVAQIRGTRILPNLSAGVQRILYPQFSQVA